MVAGKALDRSDVNNKGQGAMPNRFDKDKLDNIGDAVIKVEQKVEGLEGKMGKLATIDGMRATQDQLRKYTDDGDKGVAQAARETIAAQLDHFEEIVLSKTREQTALQIDERLRERDKAYETRKAEELQKLKESLALKNLTINKYGQTVAIVPWLRYYSQKYWLLVAVVVVLAFLFIPDLRTISLRWLAAQIAG